MEFGKANHIKDLGNQFEYKVYNDQDELVFTKVYSTIKEFNQDLIDANIQGTIWIKNYTKKSERSIMNPIKKHYNTYVGEVLYKDGHTEISISPK